MDFSNNDGTLVTNQTIDIAERSTNDRGIYKFFAEWNNISGKEEGKRVDDNQRRQMNLLLTEFDEILSLNSKPTTFAQHAIRVTNGTYIAVRLYRISQEKKKLLET